MNNYEIKMEKVCMKICVQKDMVSAVKRGQMGTVPQGHFGTRPRDCGNFCDCSFFFDDFGLLLQNIKIAFVKILH